MWMNERKLTSEHQHHNHEKINSLSTCTSKWERQKRPFYPRNDLSYLLKNGQTCFKNFVAWNFKMFSRFSTLSMEGFWAFPAKICLFKFNHGNARKRCEICSKLTIKTLERHQWRHSGVLLLTLNIFHIFF